MRGVLLRQPEHTSMSTPTGFLPVSRLAPLDYRYALDAALALLGDAAPMVRCDQPELAAECAQRGAPLQPVARVAHPCATLWVEPQRTNWRLTLEQLAAALPAGARLAVVAARPLARLLPERRTWSGAALGLRPGGMAQLRLGLYQAGLRITAVYGVHSPVAIGLNSLGGLLARAGRPDLGDRLEFAARLRYLARGWAAPLATVALILAHKGGVR